MNGNSKFENSRKKYGVDTNDLNIVFEERKERMHKKSKAINVCTTD